MIAHLAIKAFCDALNTQLTSYGVITKYAFTPELDFRRAALEQIRIFENVASNHITPVLNAGVHSNQWVVHCWNRGELRDESESKIRTFKTTLNLNEPDYSSIIATFKNVLLTIDTVFFANKVELAEDIEEYLQIYMNPRHDFNFTFPIANISFPVYTSKGVNFKFEKLTTKDFGPITMVGFSTDLLFPIIADPAQYSLIHDIYLKVYKGEPPAEEYKLMDTWTISGISGYSGYSGHSGIIYRG